MMTSSNGNIFRIYAENYWPFVRGIHRWIHRSPVNSPHKDQWRGALMFRLICALNKRLSKQSWGWWFETPSRLSWRRCNAPWHTNAFGATRRSMHLKSLASHKENTKAPRYWSYAQRSKAPCHWPIAGLRAITAESMTSPYINQGGLRAPLPPGM